ncbi:MAG: hypothetical protein NC548_31105 [Lachnospiraceae bacterium]|nr:hypothetical protein [Lachnospiraceae bacterium]MCM1232057.1 hypothetical protein [Ruminococcus flavefaciens]
METKGKQGGRREGSGRKATGLKKSARVTFYVTAEEKARIFAEAERRGMSVGDYILSRLF